MIRDGSSEKCDVSSDDYPSSREEQSQKEQVYNNRSKQLNLIKEFSPPQNIGHSDFKNGVTIGQMLAFSEKQNGFQRYYCPRRNIQVCFDSFNRRIGSLTCQVNIKNYIVPLIIIYINQQSPMRNFQTDFSSKASIRVELNNERILIKSYRYSDILEAIIQCAFMRLLQNFKAGPKLIGEYQFHILAYTDRVDIMMEECKRIFGFGKQGIKILEKKMNILYDMGLYKGFQCEKILYSQYFKQPVLIGFSSVQLQNGQNQKQKLNEKYQNTKSFLSSLKEIEEDSQIINRYEGGNINHDNNTNYQLSIIFEYANKKAKLSKSSSEISQRQFDELIESKIQRSYQYRNEGDIPCYLYELSEGIQYKGINEEKINTKGYQSIQRLSRNTSNQIQYKSKFQGSVDFSYLFNKEKASKISQKLYIKKYLQLINFFTSSSGYDESEKIKASHIMVVLWKIKQIDGYTMIQNCLFYLVNLLVQNREYQYICYLPLALANSIYLQIFSLEELIVIYQKICGMKIEEELHLQILLRSFSALQLVSLKVETKYCESTLIKIKKIYFTKITNMKAKNSNYMKLILKNSLINQADEFVLQNINLFSFIYDNREGTSRQIYLTQQMLLFICLWAIQSKKIFDKILISKLLTLIENFIRKCNSMILSHTIFYFTTIFIQYCLSVNLFQYIEPQIKYVYDLIRSQQHKLLQNFRFYYLCTLKERFQGNIQMGDAAVIMMSYLFQKNFYIREDLLSIFLDFIRLGLMKTLQQVDNDMAGQLIKSFSSEKCLQADKILYISFPDKEKQIINSRILYQTEFEEWIDIYRAFKYLKINHYHLIIRKIICPNSQLPKISQTYALFDQREKVFLLMALNFKQYARQLRKMVSITNFLKIDKNNYLQKFQVVQLQLLEEGRNISFPQYYQILYQILAIFSNHCYKIRFCKQIARQILDRFIYKNHALWHILMHYLDRLFFQSFFVKLLKNQDYFFILQLWSLFVVRGQLTYFGEHLEKIGQTIGLYSKTIPKLINLFFVYIACNKKTYIERMCKLAPMLFISFILRYKNRKDQKIDSIIIKFLVNIDAIQDIRMKRIILSNIFENRLNIIDYQIKHKRDDVSQQTCEDPFNLYKKILKTLRRKQALLIKNYQRYNFQKSEYLNLKEDRFKKRYTFRPITVLKLLQMLKKNTYNIKGIQQKEQNNHNYVKENR